MIQRLKNASILPCRHSQGEKLKVYSFEGGVVASDGRFVESSMLHESPCDVGGAYLAATKQQHLTVIYIGFLLNVWGHSLTDGLKKLWFLRSSEGQKLLADGAKVAFVTMENMPVAAHQREIWRLAGLDSSDWLHITEPTCFDEVIVPENSFVAYPDETRLFDDRFLDIINTIKANALAETTMPAKEKIYFTRTQLKNHKDANEREIERLFIRLGYEIVAPERLSIVQQISLWAQSKHVATTEGSISHSSMFMTADSNLVILRKANYVNGYQQAANRVSGVLATYFNANHSSCTPSSMPWAGPFYLCVTDELERWSGLTVHRLPVLLHPSYWWYCLTAYARRAKQWLVYLVYRYVY